MSYRTLIFTGEGKGKTTAALGMAVRAVGHGEKVFFLQFIKSDGQTGEANFLRGVSGIAWELGGEGFVPSPASPEYEKHREAAATSLVRAREAIKSGEFSLVVLDEILIAVSKRLIMEEEVLGLLQDEKRCCHIVLTGRGAAERLVQVADTVTEMRCLKHAYDEGIPAMRGVEF